MWASKRLPRCELVVESVIKAHAAAGFLLPQWGLSYSVHSDLATQHVILAAIAQTPQSLNSLHVSWISGSWPVSLEGW